MNEIVFLHCDNVVTINIANNLVQFDHIKHVDIDRFFTKDKIVSEVSRHEYIVL
jgi:hypothetical protein